jgi:hypothetical protein
MQCVTMLTHCKVGEEKSGRRLEADEEAGLSNFNLGVWSLLYQIQATTGDDRWTTTGAEI